MTIKMRKMGFTIPELVVTITVLVIIGTISFISFSGYTKTSRDTLRFSDLNNIKIALDRFFDKSGKFPDSTLPIEVTYKGGLAWWQGTFGDSTFGNIEGLNYKPVDPVTGIEYTYSLLNNKKEFELAAALEGNDIVKNSFLKSTYADTINGKSLVIGRYNGQVLNVFTGGLTYVLAVPTIISGDISLLRLEDIISNKKLAYNGTRVIAGKYANSIFNMDNTSNYSPPNYIAYKGSLDDLINDENKRILLVKELQDIYKGTFVENKSNYKDVSDLNIDILSPTFKVKEFSCFFVRNNVKRMSGCTENLTTGPAILPTTRDWHNYPTDIRGLFDTGSIYTEVWPINTCDPYTMDIIKLSPGADTIPEFLATNTIYQLSAGNYRLNRTVNINDCTGIIGNGDVFVRADNNIGKIFEANNKDNIIISGIILDGAHPNYSINNSLLVNSDNSSFNNIIIYNTSETALKINGNYNKVNNLKVYGNKLGLEISGNNNIITNILAYSNSSSIYNNLGNYNSFSNIQLFNSNILLNLFFSNDNIFSNMSLYSGGNTSGVLMMLNSNNNKFNNLNLYYNDYAIMNISSSAKYYGSYNLHSNNNSIVGIIPGNSHTILTDGVLDNAGIFGFTLVTEPSINGWGYNNQLTQLNVTLGDAFESLNLQPNNFNGTETYIFGDNIPNQSRPLRYNGTTLEYFGVDGEDYDSSKKIGQW